MTEQSRQRNNRRSAGKTALVAVAMFGFAFALIPLYNAVCSAFGWNGQITPTSAEEAAAAEVDTSRWVTVQFDANVTPDLPWKFGPNVRELRVHPGQTIQISYYAENNTDQPIVGRAIHSVNPPSASSYFKKTECFCFTQQTLEPHERRDMPVIFMVDSRLPKNVDSLVLSYNFLRVNQLAANSPNNTEY